MNRCSLCVQTCLLRLWKCRGFMVTFGYTCLFDDIRLLWTTRVCWKCWRRPDDLFSTNAECLELLKGNFAHYSFLLFHDYHHSTNLARVMTSSVVFIVWLLSPISISCFVCSKKSKEITLFYSNCCKNYNFLWNLCACWMTRSNFIHRRRHVCDIFNSKTKFVLTKSCFTYRPICWRSAVANYLTQLLCFLPAGMPPYRFVKLA